MSHFHRLEDAIQHLVIDPIAATGVEDVHAAYDIDAIAPLVLVAGRHGYELHLDGERFWAAVAAHRRSS